MLVLCVCVPKVVLFLPRGHQIVFSERLSLSIEKAFGLGLVNQTAAVHTNGLWTSVLYSGFRCLASSVTN